MKVKMSRRPGHIMRLVEKEYNQPFWDVVAGYGADGESIHATALILGYKAGEGLRTLIRAHGKEHLFPKTAHATNGWVRGIKDQKASPAKLAASRATINIARAAFIAKKSFEHDGFVGTFGQHCERAGVNKSTARVRMHRVKTLEQALFSGKYKSGGSYDKQHKHRT